MLDELGGFSSTQDRYSVLLEDGRRFYADLDRERLHDRLLGAVLGSGARARKPRALVLAGGPGAGKTTLLGSLEAPSNAVSIDPDAFKQKLPEYGRLLELGHSDWAAAVVHEESSDLAREALRRSMDAKRNVIIDATGDGEPGKFVAKLRELHAAGYHVRVVYADVPVEVALKRNLERARKTNRMVPEQFIRDLHRDVAARFSEVEQLEWLDRLELYDTDVVEGDLPVLFASGAKGNLDVLSEARLVVFRAKARV